jgi:D-amino-acid dehydrogenase
MDSIVIGAGMVGVSTALALQARGRKVLLIDRREPGRETSFGNAGLIQTEAVMPYAVPMSFSRLARIAIGTAHDVAWKPTSMLSWLNPVARYFWHSLPHNYAKIIPIYAGLTLRATDDHAPLIRESGAGHLIHKTGFIQAHRSASAFEAALREAEETKRTYNVPFEALNGNGLLTKEPHLRVKMAGAIHYTSPWSCRDPGGLVSHYAELFRSRGGEIETSQAQSLSQISDGWDVATDTGNHPAKDVVIALGPWSPQFLAALGYKIPMVFKRGYHQHFSATNMPSQPIMDVENSTVLSPMEAGLRVLTGAELNTIDGTANLRQIRHSADVARELYGIETALQSTPWRGARPCMPDMLPVIGKASRHDGLWFNFGHGHQGFTLGPTTAALLADVMSGGPAETLKPFARY